MAGEPSVGAAPSLSAPSREDPDPLFDEEFELPSEYEVYDPWEPANRWIFRFNQGLDTVFWSPLTTAYQFVIPEPARRALARSAANLNAPSIFANQLFQLRFEDASKTLGRFVLNSTVGMAGLFDAAADGAGWEPTHADFGQTLALLGVGSGPYLVVPIFGPSTVRDGVGNLVDLGLQPLTYVFGIISFEQVFIGGGQGLIRRDRVDRELEALEASSIDFYAALRSAYLQNRQAEVWGDRPREEHAERSGAFLTSAFTAF
jgi:phospholipid-binding lipoprotein MlaA